MKRVMIFCSSLILLVGVFSASSLDQVHAANATVCIVRPNDTLCPANATPLAQTLGGQLRVVVFLEGSSVLSGFDITLLADHTVLRPMGASLNGSILPGPQQVLVECLGGILIMGNVCSPTDTFDTLHFTVVACPGCVSTATTGILFTAVYNVTGTTSGIPLWFQTGCSDTSVSPDTCLTITNGSPTPVPQTVQTATFTTSTTRDFVMTASPNIFTMTQNASVTSTLTVSSVNDLSDTVSFAATVSPPGVSVSLSPSSVSLAGNQTLTSIVTVSTSLSTPTGTYAVIITGTSGSLVHSVTLTLSINPPPEPDFTITISPTGATITVGSFGAFTITLESVNGLACNITLAASFSNLGPSVQFNPANVTLHPGEMRTSIMMVSATSSTTPGFYSLLVIGRNGAGLFRTTSVFVTIPRPDFYMSGSGSSIRLSQESSALADLLLTSLGNFNGTVNLSGAVSPTGLAFNLVPTNVIISPRANASSTVTITAASSTPLGTYALTITGISGTIFHKITISVTVFPQPDFTLTANQNSFTVHKGSNQMIAFTVTSQNGFSGTLFGSATISPGVRNDPSFPIAFSTTLASGGTVTWQLPIDTLQNTRMGSYAITATLTSGSKSHSIAVTLIVTHPTLMVS